MAPHVPRRRFARGRSTMTSDQFLKDDEPQNLRAALRRLGPATSVQLQQDLLCSQATISRRLAHAAAEVATLGRGRSARYALVQAIAGLAARQPLHWVHEDGHIQHWGTLTLLHGARVHVQTGQAQWLGDGALPWLLAPLRAEGFLGRLLARRLQGFGLPADPAQWSLEQQLLAALQAPDSPGALILGEPRLQPAPPTVNARSYDALATEVSAQGAAGSTAGGEQPKFLARRPDGQAVLVKFSPPRGTPFGEQWSDLLQAEQVALSVLHEYGVPVALPHIVRTALRTYLESPRFDRIGTQGRRHVVPLWAVHQALIGGPRQHWAASCDWLAQRRRLPPQAGAQVRALLHFGRLIGNSDMHFGNLSLYVQPQDVARGCFALAPVYDMLPMRWRPDAASGELGWLPFTPEAVDLQSPARPLAERFWQRLAGLRSVSAGLRALAAGMAQRVAPA